MRGACLLLFACVLLAAPSSAQPAEPKPTRVYGVEVDASVRLDRVLVFADGPLRPRFERVDRGSVMLILPAAHLDPSAPKRVETKPGGAVHGVTIFQTADPPTEVRLTIQHSPGISPSLSRRGGQVALDFLKPGKVRKSAKPGKKPERTLDARWIGVNFSRAIIDLARFVDAKLILDAGSLSGKVSIDAPEPITQGEAAALIDALLLLKGFAAVPSPGGMRKVVPIVGAPSPWVTALEENPSEAALTTLIRLHELPADLVQQAIEPLTGTQVLVQVFMPTNSLLLAGPGNRLRRIANVARSLDEAGLRKLVMIPLRHADADFVSDALRTFAEGRWPRFEIWPDPRTNRLVVRGRPADVEQARSFVSRIDRVEVGLGQIQVLPVHHADVQEMANILTGLATQDPGSKAQGVGSLVGRDFSLSVHRPTHSLVVQSDTATIRLLADLVAELDRPPEQVWVEVTVSEVTFRGSLALAFDALLPLTEPKAADDLIAFAIANPSGSLVSNLFALSPGSGFRGRVAKSPILLPILGPDGIPLAVQIPRDTYVVTAEAGEVHSQVLFRPQMTLLSGSEHEIVSGVNVPVPVSETGGAGGALQVRQTIERRDTGVVLRVEPTVPKEGPIVLRIDLEVSAVSGALSGGATFTEREVSAIVRLEPGQEAFLASARLPSTLKAESGVPFLRSIPFLGWLFRASVDIEAATHLFITVRVERDRPEAEVLRRWMLEQLRTTMPEIASP